MLHLNSCSEAPPESPVAKAYNFVSWRKFSVPLRSLLLAFMLTLSTGSLPYVDSVAMAAVPRPHHAAVAEYIDLAAPLATTVRVVIDHVENAGAGDCFGCGQQDFKGAITIMGTPFGLPEYTDHDVIDPSNWIAEKVVDDDEASSISITIDLQEDDDTSPDDDVDIKPGPGTLLVLNLDAQRCRVIGDIIAECAPSTLGSPIRTIEMSALGENREDRARINFHIEITMPPSAPGLNIRCLHEPLWPQRTNAVTFTAETFDDNPASPRPKLASTIQVWVNDRGAPDQTCNDDQTCRTSGGPYTGTFSYACYAKIMTATGEQEVFSGWRTVQVGLPPTGRAIPVIVTGDARNRIDIVLIPDRDDYPGADTDTNFQRDAHDLIAEAYYRYPLFMKHQDMFNFWLARDTGNYAEPCNHTLPAGWNDAYRFANVGAILHLDSLRDCAVFDLRILSSESFRFETIRHETGHVPFGLADEYCCDGGYFQNSPLPNLYRSLAACRDDARTAGIGADACQPIASGVTDTGWLRLDSAATAGNDLMTAAGNRRPREADRTRIEWYFGRCRLPGVPC